MDVGRNAVKANDHDKAIKYFTNAISWDSTNAKAYILRGHEYDKKGQSELAILDFNKAISLEPNNAEVYFFRGFSYLVARTDGSTHPENAIKDFTKSLELKKDVADVYFFRALAYSKHKEYIKAIADYKKFIVLRHGKVDTRVDIAHEKINFFEQELQDKNNNTSKQKPYY